MAFHKILPLLRAVTHRLAFSFSPSRAYWGRRYLLSELSSALATMDRRVRDIDSEIHGLVEEMERSSPLHQVSFSEPWIRSLTYDIPLDVLTEDGRKYLLELKMENMRPEDIAVTLKDRTLKISARRDDEIPGSSRCTREYSYEYSLPGEVNPESVRSVFSDGVLTIEAPLPDLEEPDEPTEIPIKVDSSDKESSPKQ